MRARGKPGNQVGIIKGDHGIIVNHPCRTSRNLARSAVDFVDACPKTHVSGYEGLMGPVGSVGSVDGDVGVDLCCVEALVPQERLNAPKIRSVL